MPDAAQRLARGRDAHDRGHWRAAFEDLTAADRGEPLAGADLNRLATAAYMLGRHADHQAAMERLHRERLAAGRPLEAARAAFWLGMHLFNEGEPGRAAGWIGRAQRLADREGGDSPEQAYLLMPRMFEKEARGDPAGAADIAAEAAARAERFGEPDLLALATFARGDLLAKLGRVEEATRLLDEAMVAVTADDLSPIVTGIVYCGVILACQEAFDVRRAKEWTAALSRWCERQPDLVAYTGRCLVHRAEILRLEGDWPQAFQEARLAVDRCAAAGNRRAAGEAAYLRGELHRLQGEPAAAEDAYREASRWGREPQPGLALLRVAQGDTEAAAASIRRALAETTASSRRPWLLAACVDIMLVAGDVEAARTATAELEDMAARRGSDVLGATACQARGATLLVDGDARAALPVLRRAVELWQQLEAPYETGRVRVLTALACGDLGDEDAARLELDAAREMFERLGAVEPQVPLSADPAADRSGHLTERELEVLELVAAGHSNKAIAAHLVVSERTVHRHVSNIFVKLGVSSRTAATGYAYEHHLVRRH